MATGRRVTAEDVANRAGVSRATVSYVLNDHPHQTIPEGTREKVLQAAAELDYTPLASARILRRGRSDVVVMLIPDWPLGSVLPQVMDAVATELDPHGLELFLHRCSRSRPVRTLWSAITPAAVIRLGSLGLDEDESLRRSQIGYLLELANTELERGLVLFPGVQTGRLQAEHLAFRGHRRIGYAWPADPRLEGFAKARLEGVRTACADLGLDLPELRSVGLNPSEAVEAISAWRKAGVTAVCAFNDEIALALIEALRRQGLEVPADLGLVGVDNLPWGAHSDPPLSTVAPNPERIGHVIAQHVIAGVAGSAAEPERLSSSFISLIERDSA
jgi:DNA-binding LacI/PurR family transcriptional regulator